MLEEVIGQTRAKQVLELLGYGFKRRGKLPAVGLFGASGAGKTFLITCWAKQLNAKQIYINGTAVRDAMAFRSFFKEAEDDPSTHHIVFIDECHGLPRKVQENLLSVLEEPAVLCTVATKDVGYIQCIDGMKCIEKGNVIREAVPSNVSFVFATTDPARLKDTILNRLRKIHLEPYTLEDKIQITTTHLATQDISSNEIVYGALAKRCRSIRHLKNELCETFADIQNLYGIDDDKSLLMMDELLGIDDDGANDLDRDYLEHLSVNTSVGLDTMAAKLRIDKQEVLHHVEPFLLAKEWIEIGGKGRRLSSKGRIKVFGES